MYSAIPRTNLEACGAVHYQYQHPLDSQKSTSTINAHININMTKSQPKHDITVPVDFDVTGKESVCVADTYVVTVDFDVTATRVSGKLLCHSGL